MSEKYILSSTESNDEIKRLQGRNRALCGVTVVSLVVAVVAFCVAVFAGIVVGTHEDDISTFKTFKTVTEQAVIRVGEANGVPGYPNAYSMYAGSGSWTAKKSLPTPTSDFQAVTNGTKIYLIGGLTNASWPHAVTTLLEYDTLLETYTAKAPLPEARMRFGAAIHKGKIYVVGGLKCDHGYGGSACGATSTDQLKTTLIYDIASNTWSNGPDLSVPRSDHCAAVADGKIYAVAGYTIAYDALNSTEVMDLTATTPKWTSAAVLPAKRGDVTCASSGDKVYAIGGYNDPKGAWAPNSFHGTMFELDAKATSGSWKSMSSMSNSRGDKAAVTLSDGSIVVVAGETHARGEVTQIATHHVEQFYPKHNTWVSKAPIPTARFRFAAAAAGDFVHAFGGHIVCGSDTDTTACQNNTLNSHEVLMDVLHPDIWIHTSKK